MMLYNMSVAGVRVVEFSTKRLNDGIPSSLTAGRWTRRGPNIWQEVTIILQKNLDNFFY